MVPKEVSNRIDAIMAKYKKATEEYEARQNQIEENFNRECQELLKKYGLS